MRYARSTLPSKHQANNDAIGFPLLQKPLVLEYDMCTNLHTCKPNHLYRTQLDLFLRSDTKHLPPCPRGPLPSEGRG